MIRDWKQYIKKKEDYDAIVGSGLGWEMFIDLPFSWSECQEILKGEKEKNEL